MMDQQMPSVSFVVTVYNKARYLPCVLEQIAKQTGSVEREYIFVDDGSTDDSIRIIKSFTSDWKNVIIIGQSNHGIVHAANRGMSASRMQFIKLRDADDLLVDHATQTLLNALLNDPSAVIAYGERLHYKNESETDLSLDISGAKIVKQQVLKRFLRSNSVGNPASLILRAAVLHACGYCDERIKSAQNLSILLRLSLLGLFLRLECAICYSPHYVPSQLSENKYRELGEGQLTLYHFISDHPHLKTYVKRYACRRAARRCWILARRYSSRPVDLRYFFLYLRSFFPFSDTMRNLFGVVVKFFANHDATLSYNCSPTD